MNRYLYCILVMLSIALWSSCRKDFEYPPSSGNLKFSKDTVYLDTVFTNIGSSTRSLKVYNTSNKDIQIPTIRLSNGENSQYRLNVDGLTGKSFQNIPLLAKDSMYIFIEATIDIAPLNTNEFLYTDAIQFHSTNTVQEVQLVTLVKDAIFLFPKETSDGTKETISLGENAEGNEIRAEGFFLSDDELNFTNEKPYVIYGYAAVGDTKTLTIDAGSRVFFHNNSGLMVANGGSLKIMGALSTDFDAMENEVIFEGDRLEPQFEYVPGQWGTVWLAPGSMDNEIDHLTVKNATIGLLVDGDGVLDTPTLSIKNSQFHNSGTTNLWARASHINAENVVLGNAGNTSLYCNGGGTYSFVHCTMANYWIHGFRDGYTVKIDNIVGDLTQANFINCIIDGSNNLELFLDKDPNFAFDYSFKNCLIKFDDGNGLFMDDPLYDFSNNAIYENLGLNTNMDFINPQKNDFNIGKESSAIGNGDVNTSLLVPQDILGTNRTSSPDVGAYELITEN